MKNMFVDFIMASIWLVCGFIVLYGAYEIVEIEAFALFMWMAILAIGSACYKFKTIFSYLSAKY